MAESRQVIFKVSAEFHERLCCLADENGKGVNDFARSLVIRAVESGDTRSEEKFREDRLLERLESLEAEQVNLKRLLCLRNGDGYVQGLAIIEESVSGLREAANRSEHVLSRVADQRPFEKKLNEILEVLKPSKSAWTEFKEGVTSLVFVSGVSVGMLVFMSLIYVWRAPDFSDVRFWVSEAIKEEIGKAGQSKPQPQPQPAKEEKRK